MSIIIRDGTNAAQLATVDANGDVHVASDAVNHTTAPALTDGQTAQAQCDYTGSLFIKPHRRSQTVAQASVINASTSPVTCLAAQAAGIFADISTIIITVAPAATTDLSFTVTLSDGTASYVFDMSTGTLGGAGNTSVPFQISFIAPIPATTAATAWTVTSSVSTGVVCNITVVAVLQMAS